MLKWIIIKGVELRKKSKEGKIVKRPLGSISKGFCSLATHLAVMDGERKSNLNFASSAWGPGGGESPRS